MGTYTLTGDDSLELGASGGNIIIADPGTLTSNDTIDAGTGGDNTLELSGAGAFDLSAPAVLTDIQTVVGDAGDVAQTITLRPGDAVSVYLGGGADTVYGANNSDTIYAGSGNSTITIGGIGETFIGGDAYSNVTIDAAYVGAGGATVTRIPGGNTNTLFLTGGANTLTTIGSNINGVLFLNVQDNAVTLDTGALDAGDSIDPNIYLDGSLDVVTLRSPGETVNDYYQSDTIIMAAEDQTLFVPYAGQNLDTLDTLSGFDGSDTIDLPNASFHISPADTSDTSQTYDVSTQYTSGTDQLVITSTDPNTDDVVATETINLTGDYAGTFSVSADPSGDAEVTFSGAIVSPTPANPPPTQPVFYVSLENLNSLIGSDGTTAGTQTIEPSDDTLQQVGFVGADDAAVNGKIYLVQALGVGDAIWASDGTTNGTVPLVDLGATQQTLSLAGLTGSPFGAAGDNTIFLTTERTSSPTDASTGAFNDTYNVELWSTNGTSAGTSVIDTFASDDGDYAPVAVYAGSSSTEAYFDVDVGDRDSQLWATDGTAAGTKEVVDLGANQIIDFNPTSTGGFFSNNGTLYQVSGTTATAQPEPDATATVQRVLGTYNGEAVYAWGDTNHPNTFFVSAGSTELGTLQVNFGPYVGYDAAVQVGSNLVIEDYNENVGLQIYGSNGGADSLTLLTGATFYGDSSGTVTNVLTTAGDSVVIGGELYFAAVVPGETSDVGLYKTDGTAVDTSLVQDFGGNSSIAQLTDAGGVLYFSAEVDFSTYLYRSDGTSAGTYAVGTGTIDADPMGIVTGVTADNPAPAPQTYDLSASAANDITGTQYDDSFVATSGALKSGDAINGNGGYDRLILSGEGTFDLAAPTTLTGITEVDAEPGGVSGATQTIDLRNGTDFIDRIGNSNSTPYVVVGADNSDTIVGAGGETFSSAPETYITVGAATETVDVTNAVLTASPSAAGALILDPYSLTINSGGTVALNAQDIFTVTFPVDGSYNDSAIVLDGAADIFVAGGNFSIYNDTSVVEKAADNTISLGDNGTFYIYGAGGGDIIDEGGALASYDIIGTAAQLANDTINDFSFAKPAVDTLDITNFAYSSNTAVENYTYSGDTLTVTDDGSSVSFIVPGGGPTAFELVQNGNGTDVQVACYLRGTRIETPRGDIPIEALKIGDLVMTVSGKSRPIRWIGERRYSGRFAARSPGLMPVLIRAGALADGAPKRDLYVSPLHAMHLDGLLIPAFALVNGATIVQVERMATIEYLHLELDSHDVVFAEGAASESFVDDDSRAMFHNAASFAALYPDAARRPAAYFAPRLSEGYAVEAARHRLAVRAGVRSEPGVAPLRGFVDRIEPGRVEGWALNPERPEWAVCVEVLVDGTVVASALANRHRDDLARAGMGSGRHGFSVELPAARHGGAIEVRRALDGAALEPARTIAALAA